MVVQIYACSKYLSLVAFGLYWNICVLNLTEKDFIFIGCEIYFYCFSLPVFTEWQLKLLGGIQVHKLTSGYHF